MHKLLFATFGMLVLLVLSSFSAMGDDAGKNEPFPVTLNVGETFNVCQSGQVICPPRTPICDDLKIVDVVDTPDGMAFKGISPGTTLCSVAGGTGATLGYGFRRLFQITVR